MRGTRATSAGYGIGGGALVVVLGLALLLGASACSKPPEPKALAAATAPAMAQQEQEAGPEATSTQVPTTAASGQGEETVLPGAGFSGASAGPSVKADAEPGAEPSSLPSPTQAVAAPSPETAKLPRLVDLGAGKCIPCKEMAPILEELAETHKAFFSVEVIDVWVNPDQGKKYNVRIIPTQIFYDAQGRELYRHVGFYSKEDILGRWRKLGIDVGA